jgi:hypothetical protein
MKRAAKSPSLGGCELVGSIDILANSGIEVLNSSGIVEPKRAARRLLDRVAS